MLITLTVLIFVSCLEAAPVLVDPSVGTGTTAVPPLALKLLLVTMRVVTGPLADEGEVAVGAGVTESVVLDAPPAGTVVTVVGTVFTTVLVPVGAPAPVPDAEFEVVEEEEDGGPLIVMLWIVNLGDAFPESPSKTRM